MTGGSPDPLQPENACEAFRDAFILGEDKTIPPDRFDATVRVFWPRFPGFQLTKIATGVYAMNRCVVPLFHGEESAKIQTDRKCSRLKTDIGRRTSDRNSGLKEAKYTVSRAVNPLYGAKCLFR